MDLTPDDLAVIRDALAYAGRDPHGHGGACSTDEYLRVRALLDD